MKIQLTREQAYYIAYLRAGPIMHSWRRIAELFCETYPKDSNPEWDGNQFYGEDLCKMAFGYIYSIDVISASKDPKWDKILEAWY
jgi:hypothetical protein